MSEKLVVVLTALNLEYAAVRRRLVDPQPVRHERGTQFELGTLRGTDCQVALALVGKGNQSAAVLTERALQEFDPAAVLFVGVAGALWDKTALGDVVVATHVYASHGGTSEDDGFKARPRAWEAEHGLSQTANHVERLDDWADDVGSGDRRPRVHFGAIAAGEVVHNSRTSYEAELLRLHYNDALAIEMESAGVAQAGHLNGAPVAIVRGISDKADGTKNSDADGTWQPRAADNAAAFAARLIQLYLDGQEDQPMRHRGTPNTSNTTNNAHNSVFGNQAGEVRDSNVTITTGPTPVDDSPDLATQLAAIRDELARARSAGTVDSATYEAAQDELDLAGKALEEKTTEGRSRSMLALKRLRGLIAEAADVASKVAALITAVNGLS
ncbi:purine phosphorylase [Saccharopolyspora sp. MS10]|uniref:5'-methylthioadenosine/S-adenosylhomocysteine nucleosidase family protein n=1 Tax=Saccharopolyspora sp. MS10 TaxID=3385973 RepID=UPI0039A1B1DD